MELTKRGYVLVKDGQAKSQVFDSYASASTARTFEWSQAHGGTDPVLDPTEIVDARGDEDGNWYLMRHKTITTEPSIRCPHCSRGFDYLSDEDGGVAVVECEWCTKPVRLTCNVSVEYTAEALTPFKPKAEAVR